ncbi:DUF5325 family protein [Lentibacillus sp. L22]|uniref:DUF5325 family protein n=1 Tax=Lentibacillus TaxID=175304 RepID=UPI0022B194AE|nr:DUF5325 family protein [Lentibacillus daqui]
MKKINFPMLLLAIVVIAMFVGMGAALSYQNFWLVLLFFVLGFAAMELGLIIKRKRSDA